MTKLKLTKADKLHIRYMIKTAKWIWPKECINLKVSDFTNKSLNDAMKRCAGVAVKSQSI